MNEIVNKKLEEYYLKKFVQYLIYSDNIKENLRKYWEHIFSNAFFEMFEEEIKFQAYNEMIDKSSKNNILEIISMMKIPADKLKLFVLDEIEEELLIRKDKHSIEHYRFELKRRLQEFAYVNKMNNNDIKKLIPDIRKSIANDFLVLEGLSSKNIEINDTNIHFILDSLNVIKIEYPSLLDYSKKYIEKKLLEYKETVDVHIPESLTKEADLSLGLETLHDMDYARTRSKQFIKSIKR